MTSPAPESERAMKPSQVLTPDEARSIGLTVPTDAVAIHIYGGRLPIPSAPKPAPASCSEVVERLAACAMGANLGHATFDRAEASKIIREWEAERLKELQALCNVDYGMDLVACIKQRIDKAESELARVRGLLQRQWISVEERLPGFNDDCRLLVTLMSAQGMTWTGIRVYDHSRHVFVEAINSYPDEHERVTAWQPLAAPSGAESVEMGKVNRVDEKIDGRGDDIVIGAENNVSDLVAPPLRNERPSTIPEKVGAETGGEIQKRNQHQYDLQAAEEALAESSLSSPHSEEYCDSCGAHSMFRRRPTQLDTAKERK